MNKNNYAYVIIVVAIILLLKTMLPKYFTGNVTASDVQISGDVEKIEVIHFHETHQCSSCTAVGSCLG